MKEKQAKPYQRILAAFMLLTRLPLWRLVSVPDAAFKRATDYWSLVGWLTGGLMVLICHLGLLIDLPVTMVVSLALLSRVLLQGLSMRMDWVISSMDSVQGEPRSASWLS